MGGEIWVESELGKGSKFIFTLKTQKAERKTKANFKTKLHEKINPREMRILAVDDAAETREYFTHTMRALKLNCDVASSGQQAIQMIQAAADNPYHIFFVDWQMPEMDGIELAKKIKEINGESSIIIMISANDWNVIEKEAREAHVDHFVSKPLFPSTLVNSINTCLDAHIAASNHKARQDAPRPRYDFTHCTLLIAEDIDINREIMSAILEESGAAVEFAENGQMAVSMFIANPGKYDLILMDINMPEMDGYEATRQIRAFDSEASAVIPIIAMTANVFKEDIEKCIASGMNAHTGKPIDANELFEKLNQYLNPEKESAND